ncbi:MAG: translation initiation factor IF-5A [archaeon]
MVGTKLAGVGSLKKGNYVVLEGVACVVHDTQTSRPGKHGHAKTRIVAVGILDDKKRDVVMPGHDNVEVPIIDKLTAQILSISDKTANVMDMESFMTFDLKIPEELQGTLKEGMSILYWDILGEKVMKQVKGE